MLSRLTKSVAFKQFVKYVLVGSFVTLIDMAVLHLTYKIMGLNINLSVVIGFMCGNVSSYVLNKYYTFRNLSKQFIRQYIKYFVTSMSGLLLTVSLMYLFFERMHLFAELTQYNYLACKLLVAAIVMFWNFTIIRKWTLAEHDLGQLTSLPSIKKTANGDIFLSIIIPAYNEQDRIPATLADVTNWLQKQDYSWEIIVSDDGSTDKTVETVKAAYAAIPQVKVHCLPQNTGKGAAVKAGMLVATGKYRLFMDADNQINIRELEHFLPQANENLVIIGSKYKNVAEDSATSQISFVRKFVSRTGNFLIRSIIGLSVKDTQCGFKLFPGKAADYIFSLQTAERFSFDIEILTLASLLKVSIEERPITLHETIDTRVRALRDSISVFKDLLLIKLNVWRHKYQKSLQVLVKRDESAS